MSQAAIALNRFGLGARPDEPLPDDPRGWLESQFAHFEARPAAFAATPSRRDVAQQLADYYEATRARRARPAAAVAPAPPTPDGLPAMAAANLAGSPDETRKFIQGEARAAYLSLVEARVASALTTPAPFAERLVHFWANHFAISIDKLPVIGLGGLLEVEAIRPHLTGRFADMLLAVEQHPAMLLYLDQAQSIGPNSPTGTFLANRPNARRRPGLNENLAREILELHTLGVHGGYSQADVTEFARALTGWTVAGISQAPAARRIGLDGPAGDFAFAEPLHEPGTRSIVGRRYGQPGEGQARAVLADLAAHPATATHLATKLARHFAGDDPPRALVDRLSAAYLRSQGDLPTMYRVLIASPETWNPAPLRFKSPWDWSISAARAVGSRQIPGRMAAGLLTQLGQEVWKPGSPAGWDDLDATWAGPDALVRRVEAADRIAARAGTGLDARQLDPRALADRVLPGSISPATQAAVARAESPAQGLALLLASPEFLRR
ncbi:MAG: DUF1800 domain-containing protein [Sphingomonadales bacterium]|nr:DUF1800 domain-containing protein [Sphingomonadales bacterium]